jgi:hypothetical protein
MDPETSSSSESSDNLSLEFPAKMGKLAEFWLVSPTSLFGLCPQFLGAMPSQVPAKLSACGSGHLPHGSQRALT